MKHSQKERYKIGRLYLKVQWEHSKNKKIVSLLLLAFSLEHVEIRFKCKSKRIFNKNYFLDVTDRYKP